MIPLIHIFRINSQANYYIIFKQMKKNLFILLFLYLHVIVTGQSFTDISSQSGIQIVPAMGDLVVWFDHNNDGWLDFFGGTENETFFYENNGDGTFTNIIVSSGLNDIFPRAVAVGDCDNDGFDDLLISSFYMNEPPKVYKNLNGQGFEEVFSPTGISNSHRAIWIDFNGDGLIDFITSDMADRTKLFINKGNCQFEEATHIGEFNAGGTAAVADFDNDGVQDIYVGIKNTSKTSRLYKNIAGQAIQDVTYKAGLSDFRNTVAAAWGDMDNDGFLELYVANIGSNRNSLYYNKGNGSFEDITLSAGVSDAGDARTCVWQDINNDGWIDLFTTNHTATNKLFINNGDGTFTNIAPEANISGPTDGFGVSWGDFDKDGDLDVLISGHSFSVVLLRNDLDNENAYLNLTLKGVFDNRSAIGARATLFSNGTMQIREINGGRGATGQDAHAMHFGLGQAAKVDSIIISWPSGAVQKLYDIAINQFLTIEQEGNIPPTRFRLAYPNSDSVYQTSEIDFAWQQSFDPDQGNPISYYVTIHTPEQDTVIGPLTDTLNTIQMTKWMNNDSCFWYVTAHDGTDFTYSAEVNQLHYDYQTSVLKPIKGSDEDLTIRYYHIDPTSGTIRLEISSVTHQQLQCSLFDLSGRLIRQEVVDLPQGNSSHQLIIDSTDKIIILHLQTTSGNYSLKLIK